MLSFTYQSSNGNTYNLITDDKFISECNAFNYEYSPITFGKRYGAKIYGFEMPMKEFEATFYVFGENRQQQINELISAFEYDIINQESGTIGTYICNGYSIQGYSVAMSDTTQNSHTALWDSFKRKFICPYPFWSKETQFRLFQATEAEVEFTDIKDYIPVSEDGTADYPWDYMTAVGKNGTLVNEDLIGSEWVIVINGGAVNPTVVIGDLTIAMNLTVPNGASLTIDSRNKTLELNNYGVVTNVFGYRDVSVDIFKKIPYGTQNVTWYDDENSDFSFTVALYDERSAPLWN